MKTTGLAPPPVSATARVPGFPAWAAFGLTPRAFVLLTIGLIFIAPAWIDRRALVLLVIWDAALVALCWINYRRLPSPADVEVTRSWRTPLVLGDPAAVDVAVRYRGAADMAVRITDYVSGQLRMELPELSVMARPNDTARTSYDIAPRERGDAAMGAVVLRWRDRWGLVERWGLAPIDQTVRVYPSLREGQEQARYLVRSRQVTLEKRRAKRFTTGREFDSLRDYRQGDERRDVCWSASARRGKLVTKVYQPERSQTVWILVDAGRLLRARLAQGTLLDATVTAALTLAQVALASGDRVGLLTYGRRLQHRAAPARGAAHLRAMVEALATVRADGVEADHAGAAATVMAAQKRRALVVWLTEVAETAGTPDVIEHASRMSPAHVVLFGVLRQQEISALAATAPETPSTMYRVMSAQETVERRQALLHGLRQRGALVLEMSPADIAGGLVDRYLEVKERGLL